MLVLLMMAASTPLLAGQGRVLDSTSVDVARAAPLVVSVRAANVSIAVEGHARSTVIAMISDSTPRAPRISYIGMLRVSAHADSVSVELARPVDMPRLLHVAVPFGATVHIAGDNGGSVRVAGVGGPVEITYSNGGVSVADAGGSALVATSNGNVDVSLRSLSDVPMSILTNNGNVDLTLPATAHATLVVDDVLSVQSDFPLARQPARGPESRLLRLEINGGGPAIRIFTDNGVVRVHRARP